MSEKCYGRNEDEFNHLDLNDLLQEMEDDDALVEGAVYYVADARTPKASEFFSADDVLERASNCAGDEGGEWAEDLQTYQKAQ